MQAFLIRRCFSAVMWSVAAAGLAAFVSLSPVVAAGGAKSDPGPFSETELPKNPVVFKLADGVYQYVNKNGLWNSGFVITPDGVAVFDAMLTPADARLVIAEIRKRTDKPIKYLFITHMHSDHYFGAQEFSPPAEIVAHPVVYNHYKNNLEKEFKFRKTVSPNADLSEVKVVLPTKLIDAPKTVFNLGGTEIQALHFGPGQTPGPIFYYLPQTKVLFTGDQFNQKSINFMAGATSLEGWLGALDKIEAMDVSVYAGGHGLPARKSDIAAYRTFLNAMISSVKDAIAKGWSAEEAVKRLTFEEYRSWRNYERFLKRNIAGLHKRFSGAKAGSGK